MRRFGNADRLDLLLTLIRNDMDARASVAGDVRVIRGLLAGLARRASDGDALTAGIAGRRHCRKQGVLRGFTGSPILPAP